MTDKFVMLDLETVANRINPAIAQISAVPFTLEGGVFGEPFSMLVDLQSCFDVGLESNEETLKWWSEQSEAARQIVFSEVGRHPLSHVLSEFTKYLDKLRCGGALYLWGNGVRADNVWLLSAYKACGMSDPIAYNEDLDYRTLHYLSKKKSGVDFKKTTEFAGVQHNAIDDCIYQIDCAVKMWSALND